MKKNDRTEDYAAAIKSAMEILHLQEKIKDLKRDIRSRLTCTELQDGDYVRDVICDAFAESEVGITPSGSTSENATCHFGDASVFLLDKPGKLSVSSIRRVIHEAGMSNA